MNYLIEMKNNGNGDNHLCNRGMALPGARETAFGSMTIVNKVMSLISLFFSSTSSVCKIFIRVCPSP